MAGSRTIGESIEELARPIVAESRREASYREMSLDADRESEAGERTESLIQDSLRGGPLAPR